MTLVISARACKTEVPLLLVERVDVTTTGALVKVTVEVNVLSEVERDVVLELFMGRAGGGPGGALGAAGEAEDNTALTEKVRRSDEGKLCELLDVVALTELDRWSPGDARLIDMENEVEMTLLDFALPAPTDVDETSVAVPPPLLPLLLLK
ncbi:hypothetical protein E8E11_010910 [Didymella keratinophila]|nr:hypothetical protein E8E11_010910 [Didymella keratinophila]